MVRKKYRAAFISSCGIPDGDMFGQERDKAELLDRTVVILPQEQLRNVSIEILKPYSMS